MSGRNIAQEMPRQWQDVLAPLLQRRHPKDPAGDPVVQVAAEMPALDRLRQVPVGRADQPERGVAPRVAAHALVGALLDDAQQLRLQRHRQFADLVEKQRPAVRRRERAVARRHRAGERAALVAEELAARQLRHDRRAVEDDEFVSRSHSDSSSWIERAISSLPVPLSPISRTKAGGEAGHLDDLAQRRAPRGADANQLVLDRR